VLLLEELIDLEGDQPGGLAEERDGVDSGRSAWEEEEEKPDSAPFVGAFGGACGSLEAPGGTPVPLSKFRHCVPRQPLSPGVTEADPGVEELPAAPKGTALGRLKLVKRRKRSGNPPPKPSVIQRLLSSF
jgi:hypothetical protein